MQVVADQNQEIGVAPACAALGIARASFYRWQRPHPVPVPASPSPRALSPSERQSVLEVLHEPRFVDRAPAEVYATLLDEGHDRCSERTMYRILAGHQEVRERRDQLRHPTSAAPARLATRPNEVWSWDITKLLGTGQVDLCYLYVILDLFSRSVVGGWWPTGSLSLWPSDSSEKPALLGGSR